MSAAQPTNESWPVSRYEFRSFGQHFNYASKRMARLSEPVPEELWERHSDEIYIVSVKTSSANVKIRDGEIEIKILLETTDGFEQWQPLLQAAFPIPGSVIKDKILTALQIKMADPVKHMYSLSEFISLIDHHPYLQTVAVKKQRAAYMVNKTICETAVVLINGAKVVTISCESTNINDIKQTIKDIGLEGIENINYLQAIQRVTGIIKKQLAN